ncbi:hypothetical protein GLAREA_07687 [Glarea lozoyensis ATCC 20868]|uniref:Uncharacterized protein n=1 Tax=Glarea lozoyensis (strain ATCC 20868 / MF5171) TaxID=1116229 RepID=S3E254_GLAL2|nr:uncharacterized protein GLAREA_07687 [Glarea lozoyensis ATCC 20868]EPE32553.1 hypothetical protein GLAREA_07687 [Glarea lozoyensis ATCC 20868]
MHSFTLLTSLLSLSFTVSTLAAPVLSSKATVSGRAQLPPSASDVLGAIEGLSRDMKAVTSALDVLLTATDATVISDLAQQANDRELNGERHRIILKAATLNTNQESEGNVAESSIKISLHGDGKSPESADSSIFGKLQTIIDAPASGQVVNNLAREIEKTRSSFMLPSIADLMNAALAATGQAELTVERADLGLRGTITR